MHSIELLVIIMIVLVKTSLSRRNLALCSKGSSLIGRNFFALRQSLNLPGLKAAGLLFTQPRLLIPDIELKGIQYLNVEKLQERGIRCIVFDKDNTLRYLICHQVISPTFAINDVFLPYYLAIAITMNYTPMRFQ